VAQPVWSYYNGDELFAPAVAQGQAAQALLGFAGAIIWWLQKKYSVGRT